MQFQSKTPIDLIRALGFWHAEKGLPQPPSQAPGRRRCARRTPAISANLAEISKVADGLRKFFRLGGTIPRKSTIINFHKIGICISPFIALPFNY